MYLPCDSGEFGREMEVNKLDKLDRDGQVGQVG